MFCQNEFPAGFLESLSKHFSKDYEKLQRDIASFRKALEKLKNDQIHKKNLDPYAHHKDEIKKLQIVVEALSGWIDKAIKQLEEKRKEPFSTITSLNLRKILVVCMIKQLTVYTLQLKITSRKSIRQKQNWKNIILLSL